MNGDRLHDRKDPLPLSRGTTDPETGGEHHEPRLRDFGDEPPVTPDTGFIVPADLRAAHQGRGSAPIIVIAAFVVFCAGGGAYAYWKFAATDDVTPSAQITAPAAPATTPAPAAAAQPYQVNPPPAQPAADVTSATPAPAPPTQAAPASTTIDPAAAARRKAADDARRAAEKAARAWQAAEQAQREKDQADKLRLAAIRHHEEKLRADRERKEAALRKAQQQRARQEQAVQEQIDQATAAANPAPQLPVTPPKRRQQNADLPQTSRGDGPPLDARDLPPPAAAGPENQ